MKRSNKIKIAVFLMIAVILTVFAVCCALDKKDKDDGDPAQSGSPSDDAGENDKDPDGEHTHSFNNWTLSLAPTCSTVGQEVRKCACGEEESREVAIDASAHKFDTAGKTVAPSCTSKGYTVYSCVCGKTHTTDYVDALGHTEQTDAAVAPTCTASGKTEGKHCSVCNTVLTPQLVVSATGHSFGDWVVTKAATENAKGEKRRDCSSCEVFEISVVAELSHSHSAWPQTTLSAVAPTCTETGLTEGKKCSGCGEILVAQTTVAAKGHTYSKNITAPTCTSKGYTTYTCHCNDTYTSDFADALGHTEVTDAAVSPTCTATGKTEGKHCSVCSTVLVPQTVVDALGHDYGEEITKAPGCTEKGEKTYTCKNDSEHTYKEEVAPKGHSYTKVGDPCSDCGELKPSEGLAFLSNGDGTCYVGGYGECTDSYVVIPKYAPNGDRVIGIGESAFGEQWSYDNRGHKLSKVHIPDTVTYIGEGAFGNCFDLKEIVIPSSVVTVEGFAFQWCMDLEKVTISNGVEKIGPHAFANTRVMNITIPASVTTIEHYAFYYCNYLSSISVDEGNKNFASLDGNLYNKSKTELVQYATGKSDTSFTVPGGVEKIGHGAFSRQSSLTEVILPEGLKYIGDEAFYVCDKLERIDIPDSVTEIGASAFESCHDLGEVSIGRYVEKLGGGAFRYCRSLESVTVPSSVREIGTEAFFDCTQLGEIIVASGNGHYRSLDGNLYNKDLTAFLQYAVGKTESSFILPESVTEIGESAFANAVNLSEVNIPNGVENVGHGAFSGCTELKIYCDLEKEGDGWVSDWNPDSCHVVWLRGPSEGLEYISLGNGTCEVSKGSCTSTSVIIPSTSPSGERVVGIAGHAFKESENIVSVVINEGVEAIGMQAFSDCVNLKTVVLPDSLTEIGWSAFNYCSSLEKISIGSNVSDIGGSVFVWCHALSLIEVSEENEYYKSIDGNLYSKDGKTLIQYAIGRSDTSFEVPDGVITISDSAVADANNLERVVISDDVKEIKTAAFSNCQFITEIIIGSSVEYIGYNALDCLRLESIVMPKSVKTIEKNAFHLCSKLKTVNYTGSEADWAGISIGDGNTYLTGATINYNYEID